MKGSPQLGSGVVSIGLHLAIIASLMSSGMTLSRRDSLPAVSYVDLTQLWLAEELLLEPALQAVRLAPPNPLPKAQKTESKPSQPARSKSLARKLSVPAAEKLSPESVQALSKPLVLASAPVDVATSPAPERQPQPVSPTTENAKSEERLPIKKVSGAVAGTIADTMERALLEATPIVTENSPPSYPRIARRRGWEGDVLLLVQVDKAGQVLTVQLDRSSGHGVLDRVALEAVRGWRFHAARFNYKPVKSEVMVTIRFEFQKS